MRVIGGKYRSRVLSEFAGQEVRPTSDRAKEALFNILAFKTIGARVLDLFAGSGSLGIESLSRGAKEVVFNDAAKDSLTIVKKNLNTLKISIGEEAKLVGYDFATCLQTLQGKFDIIFLDPPYRLDYGRKAMEIIVQRGLLSENGVIVYERDRTFDGEIAGLNKYDERKYGKTYFTFFKKDESYEG